MLNGTTDLKRSSLRDQALTVLREGLVSGDLAPGEIYSATALANELGVSASPVREAMLTLVNQGLMEPVRNRGFRVLPIDDRDRREIFDLRVLLEVPATASLAGNEEIKERYREFKKIADEIVNFAKKGELIDYLEADRRFHLGLLAYTDNDRLVAIVEGLRDHTRLFGLRHLAERGVLTLSAKEHILILDAIVAGDADLTSSLMLKHLDHIKGDWAEPNDED
jgi:DNA-binding GntR family transcriptional regulator